MALLMGLLVSRAAVLHDTGGSTATCLPARRPNAAFPARPFRYGTDKPDTRFGLEHVDVSAIVADCGFQIFSGAVATGGIVKALMVPADQVPCTAAKCP